MPRRQRRRPVPQEIVTARIEALAHDGRGVTHVNGKTVFVHGALPGEAVELRYSASHSQYDEGTVHAIVEPVLDRVTPRCAHFGVCGGCALQHLDPAKQILYKQDWLLENLARIGKVQPQQVLAPLTGPLWGYRHKARLGVKYLAKQDRVLVGFHGRATPVLADLRRCEVLHPRAGLLLAELGELIRALSIYNRIPQVEVAQGDAATALSFRVLSPPTPQDQALLIEFGQRHEMQIYLQPKGPETTQALWPQDAVLSYSLPDYGVELQFLPYHFTQVNLPLNRLLVTLALELLALQAHERVLDLFCGLGNFSLAAARRATAVVGIEGDAGLVAWAERNAAHNGIANARFASADLTADCAGALWLQDSYDKVLLDPPRLGAWEVLPVIARLGPRRIVYVSCHPATLARDAGELVRHYGYKLISAGVMDMFAHTAHVESIALFER